MNAPEINSIIASPETQGVEVAVSLSLADLQLAKASSAQSGQHVLDVMQERSGLHADAFVEALGCWMQYPVLSALNLNHMTPDFALLPLSEASRLECMVVRDLQQQLYVVIANPFEASLMAKIDVLLAMPYVLAICHRKDLSAYLARFEANMSAMQDLAEGQLASEGAASGIEDISLKSISEDTSAVVKLVRSTLYDALKAGASDIHIETDAHGLIVRYRIDGVLNSIATLAGIAQAEQVISRIKVMSELDISERRIPQDGRFKVQIQGREIDMRVSIIPTVFGEDAVLRVLDRNALNEQAERQQGISLDVLGFETSIMQRFRLLAEEPYGMLLVTGPTGSGKTTTLYGIISEVNHGQDKIVTIEDPVEYQLPGVMQIPVNEKKGLTFARGLRSVLRHDPDKIMVGEIRDAETAQIAVQSALTGHLVFSTIHANNVFDVIGRFTNMQVDPYSFVSAINGILAQRLIRINCPHCTETDTPDAALIAKSGLTAAQASSYQFKKGQGCGQCHGTGYKGRKAIAELLCFNDDIRELIVAKEPIRKIKEAAHLNGTRTMREAALNLVRQGETTLQEINRVTSMV